MSNDVQPIPEGYRSVTPMLTIQNCSEAIEFYKRAFNAEERMRAPGPDGSVMHAELQIGDSVVMMHDEFPEKGAEAPPSVGGSPVGIYLYVEDVDTIFEQAVDAGADVVMEPEDKFYGDRLAGIRDPYGHKWTIATHVEDVDPEEMERRQKEAQEEWSE